MNTQTQQETSENHFTKRPQRRLSTLTKFAERYSDFTTLSAITNQVFKAESRHSTKGEIPGNGMLEHGVIVRIGRRVLIDEAAFFEWVDRKGDHHE